MSKKPDESIAKKYDFKPSIFYILGGLLYLAGTFMPWIDQYNIYSIGARIASWVPTVVLSVSIALGALMLLQIFNCIMRKTHLKILYGIVAIIVSVAPWLTFLGSLAIVSLYYRVGVGASMAALGTIITFVSAIAVLASNRKTKH